MQILVDCSGDDNAEKTPETAFLNKKNALVQILEENPVPKTIIFCNKVPDSLVFAPLVNHFEILILMFESFARLRHVGKLRIYLSGSIEMKGSCTSYLFMLHSHKSRGLQTWKSSPHLSLKKTHCFWFAQIGTSSGFKLSFCDAMLLEH